MVEALHIGVLPPSPSRYQKGCRCADCTAAWVAYYRPRTRSSRETKRANEEPGKLDGWLKEELARRGVQPAFANEFFAAQHSSLITHLATSEVIRG